MGSFQFVNQETIYPIPQDLDIQPNLIIDEYREVYRISIGKISLTKDEGELYTALFNAIDSNEKKGFIDECIICEGKDCLRATVGFIYKTIKYGKIYDIEFGIPDTKFYTQREEKENNAINAKGKKVNRRRKATNKSKS